MKFQTLRQEYYLDAASVDEVSEKIEAFLGVLKTEPSNILRIRLSIEEVLLRFRDRFGPQARFLAFVGMRFGRPTISLELTGERFNPLGDTGNGLGEWSANLLGNIGLDPGYVYQNGVNVVQLKLKKPRRNPAFSLLLSIAVGAVIGLLGRFLLPESTQALINLTVLEPIQNVFFNILNAASGPVIFLSVITAVCGAGSAAVMGRSGKRMLVRFLCFSTGFTLISAVVGGFFCSLALQSGSSLPSQFSTMLTFFSGFVPSDLLSPFTQGDSPQIVLIALILGNALLFAGAQAGRIVTLVEQLDNVGLIVADWVSRISPFFISLLLIFWIMRGSLSLLLGIWKPLLVVLALVVLFLFFNVLYVSKKKKVGLRLLVRKIKKPFFIALRTASVDAAYGANRSCCETKLGLDRGITKYGLPLGLVSYMPASSAAVIVFLTYAAGFYGVPITIVWGVTAVLLTVVLIAATPPMAGIGLLTYAALFSRLSIPQEALTAALIADILFGFLCSACNQAMLQMELILEADKIGMLDAETLRS